VLGTNTSGALAAIYNASAAGTYNVTLRYTTNGGNGGGMKISKGKSIKYPSLSKTAINEWGKATVALSLSAGSNKIIIANVGGINAYIDQIIITPANQEEEKFAVTVREAENGYGEADITEAAEGTTVTLTAYPEEGFVLEGWNIIHGEIEISEEGTFTMPDDNVTVQPVFKDTTIIYNLDYTDVLAGTLPEGWVATQENSTVHSYPNSYSSGARVIAGFPGTYSKALYWRYVDCQYGTQEDYPLTLKPGKYRLIYSMAAWNGSSNYKAQILRGSSVIATGATFSSAPNAAESTGTDLSSAAIRVLDFEVTTTGNYIIKFASVNSTWQGFLLTSCRLNNITEPTGIYEISSEESVNYQEGPRKYIENNRIIILKNGKKYNTAGATLGN